MKRPQEPLTTMETLTTMEIGGSLSKGKDRGDLAGRIGFGSKVVAGGNQGLQVLLVIIVKRWAITKGIAQVKEQT